MSSPSWFSTAWGCRCRAGFQSARTLRMCCPMSRTRSANRHVWAARPTGAWAAVIPSPASHDTSARQEGPAIGRPCGAHGSRSGAAPTVTPSRVTLQRSVGPAPSSPFVVAHRTLDLTALEFGVARGEREASNSHTLPQRPRQTGLPGPTPTPFRTSDQWSSGMRVIRTGSQRYTVLSCRRRLPPYVFRSTTGHRGE